MSRKKKNETVKEGRNADGTFAPGNNFAEVYRDEFADKLLEFFSQPLTYTEMKVTYFKGEVSSETPVEFVRDFPTMGMFARSIGVSVSALISVSGKIEAEGTFIRADFVGERGSIVLAAVFPMRDH